MTRELKLQVPEAVYESLLKKAEGQGVSLETLCLSLLLEDNLLSPNLYFSLQGREIREEIKKVAKSNLGSQEISSRIRKLESLVLRSIK